MMSIFLLLFLSLAVLTGTTLSDFTFSFPSFGPDSCGRDGRFICMGSAVAQNGSLVITPDADNATAASGFLTGRVMYKTPVLAWPATLITTFTVRIMPGARSAGADGMAFIMAPDSGPSPPQSVGSFLGILGPSTQGGVVRQLAVELDTFKNEFDGDPDGNHIAIDTVDVRVPVAVKSLNDTGINLKSGRDITIRITYNGTDKFLRIYVAYTGRPPVDFLNQRLIMKNTVPSNVYVGFSAATGSLLESHQILNWNFTSIELPASSLKTGGHHGLTRNRVLTVIVLPILSVCLIVTLGTIFMCRYLREKRRRNKRKWEIDALTSSAVNAPKMFTYRTLSKATQNFSKENLLGTGGFGSVYKGRLSEPPTTIAVKKMEATSTQGEKEYLAEICTIGRLRHKNLVQLQGWCHDRDQLLLVYDYMTNGSLDRYIERIYLNWEQRCTILLGLASALVYLHEECGHPVVHRDVKPNNVMIDSEFNACLGDFGMARLVPKNKIMTTTVAGTLGYMAPEVAYTGRATPESDVYSFGMVVVEVVCGRRSRWIIDDSDEEEKSLVESLWESYERQELVKCVDAKLEGRFDEEQAKRALMVGLACLYPDIMVRPTMRKVVRIFMDPMEPLMGLPPTRPLAFCLPYSFSPFTAMADSLGSSPTTGGTGAGPSQ